MKKKITKEQIIDTTIDLIRDKSDLRGLTMREIARTLGCAHTNIYNHFPGYTGLLWETLSALQKKFMGILKDDLSGARSAKLKLKYFFNTFVRVYLGNKGWFRLAWLEHIGGARPQGNIEVTKSTRQELDLLAAGIWKDLSGKKPDMGRINRVMHTSHCYMIGELSNYISGRGLINNDAEFIKHTSGEAMRVFTLCMREE